MQHLTAIDIASTEAVLLACGIACVALQKLFSQRHRRSTVSFMPSSDIAGFRLNISHSGPALKHRKETGVRWCSFPCILSVHVCSASAVVSLQGVGLCHGIAGSGYALLSHGRATGDERQLRQAARFAQFAADHWQELCAVPDAPASLFEVMPASSSVSCCSKYTAVRAMTPHNDDSLAKVKGRKGWEK